MNFFKFHLGDYAQATAHLSFVEDAAYLRLLRKYYAEEKPLPSDLRTVQRLVGARSDEEKQAVDDVLKEFFTLTDDGWRNSRCDEEIAKASAQAETNRRIAAERESRRRTRKSPTFERSVDGLGNGSCNESFTGCETDRQPNQTPDSKTPDSSVTDVTGGKPPEAPLLPLGLAETPPADPEEPEDPPADPEEPEEPKVNAAEVIFIYGLSLLVNAGTEEKQARSFLGGLRKLHGDDALVDAIARCAEAQPLQPLEWLAAALPPKVQAKGHPGRLGHRTNFDGVDYGKGVGPGGTF